MLYSLQHIFNTSECDIVTKNILKEIYLHNVTDIIFSKEIEQIILIVYYNGIYFYIFFDHAKQKLIKSFFIFKNKIYDACEFNKFTFIDKFSNLLNNFFHSLFFDKNQKERIYVYSDDTFVILDKNFNLYVYDLKNNKFHTINLLKFDIFTSINYKHIQICICKKDIFFVINDMLFIFKEPYNYIMHAPLINIDKNFIINKQGLVLSMENNNIKIYNYYSKEFYCFYIKNSIFQKINLDTINDFFILNDKLYIFIQINGIKFTINILNFNKENYQLYIYPGYINK